jgi:flagellar hook-basal body complex protein FliE
MAIAPVRSLGSLDPGQAYARNGVGRTGDGFADQLRSAVDQVNRLQIARDEQVEAMVRGEVTEVHEVMVAAEEAQLAFELLLEVRNKLLESYQELMRMQV